MRRARPRPRSAPRSVSLTPMVPRYGSRPATARSSVVLPAPFGPIRASQPPGHRAGHAVQDLDPVQVHAELVDRDRAHVRTAVVDLRIQTNTGEPTSAVTTPMGSSAGETTVRARVSARTRKPAPDSSDSGSTRR